MKKFLALLMMGVLVLSCAGAALAIHDGGDGKSAQGPTESTPTDKQSAAAEETTKNDFPDTTYATSKQTKDALSDNSSNLDKLSDDAANKNSESGETTHATNALGKLKFTPEGTGKKKGDKIVATLKAEMKNAKKGDRIGFFFNKKAASSPVLAADDSASVVFLDDTSKRKITTFERDGQTIFVTAEYEVDAEYEPLVTASSKSASTSGHSGCDAGMGTLALMAVAVLGAKKFF